MDASNAFAPPIRARLDDPVLFRLGRMLALASIGLAIAAGLLVCARRASGALAEPLAPGMLAALGIVLAALAVLFRRAFAAATLPRVPNYVLWAAPSVVILIWVAAVSLQGSETLGLVALVGALLVEEGYSWGRLRLIADAAPQHGKPPRKSLVPRAGGPPAAAAMDVLPTTLAERDEAVTQSMIRRKDETGETIEGWLRVDFAASQRHAAAHLAICPPMDRPPECFAEQTDGPAALIKIAQVLAYGVRFEVKLDRATEESACVVIEFSIQGPASGLLDESQ